MPAEQDALIGYSAELRILVSLAGATFSQESMYLGSRHSGTVKVVLIDLYSKFAPFPKKHHDLLETIKISKGSTWYGEECYKAVLSRLLAIVAAG